MAAQSATSPQLSSSHSNHTPPLSRLARLGAGLGLGSSRLGVNTPSASARPIHDEENDSDWYIPYNGPYELPPKNVVGAGVEDATGKGKGKRREVRDSWADFLTNLHQADPFARDNNVSQTQISGGVGGNGAARTRSQKSGSFIVSQQEDERGRTRSRAFSGSSKHPDSSLTSPISPLTPRPRGHTFGHGSLNAHARAPVPSFVDLGTGEIGIGESPVPIQRVNGQVHSHGLLHGHERQEHSNHAHFAPDATETFDRQHRMAQAVLQNPRASHSSFWTFGAGGSRKSAPSIYSGSFSSGKEKDMGRPSAETYSISNGRRPSTSTYQTQGTDVNGGANGRDQVGTRDRSATFGEKSFIGLGGSHVIRQRANTNVPPSVTFTGVFSPPSNVSAQLTQQSKAAKGKQHLDVNPDFGAALGGGPSSDQSHSTFSFQNHPYAVSFPSSGHREHSRLVQPPKKPMIRLAVPFLSPSKSNLPHHLRNSSSRFLKASVSTPNLRTAASVPGTQAANAGVTAGRGLGLGQRHGTGSGFSSPSASPKWLSAETWCDALIFPRPRFKMRGAAHQITPPGSPIKLAPSVGSGSSQGGSPKPLNGGILPKDTIKKDQGYVERKWPLMAPPTSAPPLMLSSSVSYLPVPKSDFGTSDKQKGDEVQPKSKNGENSGGLKPYRPKSFAMDDLALPSPVPSLDRVIREKEAFEKERNEWKNTATKSFQNKRARSLSRSRLKAMAHRRKDSAEETELVTSFGIIAASAFHGHQLSKPSISVGNSSTGSRSMGTNSTGIVTTSTHSRKSSNESHTTRGHARKESWSKSAIKSAKTTANATGLCVFNVDVSPVDEKALDLQRTIDQDDGRTKFVNLDAQRDEEKRDAGEGGVVLIASHANTNVQMSHHLVVPQPRPAVVFAPSPVPSDNSDSSQSTSHSGVGIALSTPTVLAPDQEQFQFPDHPFASPANRETVPRASDYAGPHPTSAARLAEFNVDDSTLNNVSARHRLPPAVNRLFVDRHPYAAAQSSSSSRPRPTLQVPTTRDEISPSRRMFAEVNSNLREVLPDEIQYSPYSLNPPSRSSKRDSDALGVEEALSVAFTHRSLDDLDMDETEDDPDARTMDEEDLTGTSAVGAQILVAQPATRSAPLYRMMPQIDEDFVRDSWRDSRDEGESTIMPISYQHTPAASGFSMKESSPSINSSPMTSPRLFKKYDESEDFSDLFYRPGHSAGNSIRASSMELTRGLSSREPSGSIEKQPSIPIARTASVSALTGLTQQLSQEYSSLVDDERHTFGGRDSPLREQGRREEESELHALLSRGSPGANVPLRVPMTRPQSIDPSLLVPEDIASSRASSILEPQGTEEGTDITYRLGEVPALSTPDPTSVTGAYRSSAHGSYFGDIIRDDSRPTSTQDATYLHPQRPSLAPPPTSATDTSRTSYVTSTSSNSRISQLSDFPAPPNQGAMTPGSIIQSYFRRPPEEPQENEYDPSSNREISARRSRRTTFGGEEEISSFDMSDA